MTRFICKKKKIRVYYRYEQHSFLRGDAPIYAQGMYRARYFRYWVDPLFTSVCYLPVWRSDICFPPSFTICRLFFSTPYT